MILLYMLSGTGFLGCVHGYPDKASVPLYSTIQVLETKIKFRFGEPLVEKEKRGRRRT